ncbi:DUF4432 family protein [Herbiconiux sp. CPCC 205763]|uniref:DUF4432 family protein n=1 Tax=Herbiconiux aconitum TaxID=2970913 RepID=A0ABT2GL17_9MICO|nr:DUF4432 family protein [Herbiconiux aconitum]MCS5716922.1 DUF4432 family protein [Herbiconiux aconitum]
MAQHSDAQAITIDNPSGLSLTVLPQRGLDIGEASFDGGILSWAPAGGVPKVPAAEGPEQWRSTFGGLVATCGLNNVGWPSEGYGMHGSFTLTAAHDVSVARDAGAVSVTGVVTDGDLVCHRSVVVTDRSLAITDVVTNTAAADRQAPILYHVNFGAPFLGAELVVDGAVATSIPRDPLPGAPVDWRRPARNAVLDDFVIEHLWEADAPRVMTLTDAATRRRVSVGWSGLHRLHQWIDLTPRYFVTAIEPSNSSVQGREFDRAAGRAPILRAGESRTTGVTISCENLPI